MSDKVARVRRLLDEARQPKPTDTPELQLLRAYEHYAFNTAPPPERDQSPRARAIREVGRIASWYGWPGEVDRALDQAGAGTINALSDDQLEQLRARLVRLEECTQEGFDPPDAPPAR